MNAAARKFTVGQVIWKFDPNRRAYQKDENGCTGPLNYSAHFRPMAAYGIQGRSYLIGRRDGDPRFAEKIAFAKAEKEYLNDTERDEKIWHNCHRSRIVNKITYGRDVDVPTLKKIAELIGYDADLAEPEGRY